MSRRKRVDPTKFKTGTPVYFHPIIGELPRYAGITENDPWLLGGHTWVVNLCNMDPSYEYAATKGNRVIAACLEAIDLRKP